MIQFGERIRRALTENPGPINGAIWRPVLRRISQQIDSDAAIQALRIAHLEAFVREWSERFGFLATENPRDSIESIDEVATVLRSRARWCLEARTPTKRDYQAIPTWHEFQGRLDRDCELCGKPDRHPNHNPEGKFNG